MASVTSTDELIAQLAAIDGKAEIVEGRVVRMSPSGKRHVRASYRICKSLEPMEKRLGGCAYTDCLAFLVDLPNRKSFSPDVAFCLCPIPADDDLEFEVGAPIFAVEIRSKSDYGPRAEERIAQKRADYFAAGTKVVWDVDFLGEDTVRVYRADAPDTPTIYRRGQHAEAEPAVPGWSMPVDELFK